MLRQTARHRAIHMSFEDVIRLAQAEIDPARFQRIAAEMGIAPGTPFAVVEFLKPGIKEITAILPPFLARPILALSARTGWLKALSWGMEIKTSSVAGYLRFHLLSRWRRFRQRSYRYAEDQQAIETWLALIVEDRSVRRSSPSRSSRVPDCSKATATPIGAAPAMIASLKPG